MARVITHHRYLAPILLSLLPLPTVSSLSNFSFNFSLPGSFNREDLIFFTLNSTHANSKEGPADTHISPNEGMLMIHSDKETIDYQSIVRVVYAHPVQLRDDTTGEVASFSMGTAFCLRDGSSKNTTGARVAIFLGPYQPTVVHPPLSSCANRSNANDTTRNDRQIIKVEFDAYLQKKPENGGWEHVISVDIDSVDSKVRYWNRTFFPADIKNTSSSGPCTMMLVRIDYDAAAKRLGAGLRIGDAAHHHVNASVDLGKSLPKEVAVGFASTTGQPIELRNLLLWSFNSTPAATNLAVAPPRPVETDSSAISCWKQFLVRLDPWNWHVELSLQFQFLRIWESINVAFNSSFSVSLVYGIANWN